MFVFKFYKGRVSTENRFKSCREYRDSFVWSKSINSRKTSFSGIAPVGTHNNSVYHNHLWRWLSVQEFQDMVEAEFYLGQGVQSICVCVCVCVLWKQKRLSNTRQGYKISSFWRKKDSFYVILKRKYSFRRDSNPRSMGCEETDLPLSYLTCWWMGIKIAYIKYKSRCLQINQVYAIVIKWQIVNNFEQNAV